ncbi:MAG: efflux RND transporter permease subunit [Ignavibacteriales bacterium]|nr:efflux RND transporter permease subunit [Ignavibacteriales bacterium]
MILSDLSIKRPVMMTMFLLVFVLFGIISYFSLNLDLMPDVDIPYVTVQTVYPGAGPQEIETQVTKKIEDAVSTVSQIKSITSYSLEGVSIVMIEFELDKDIDIANQETKDNIDAIISQLPTDSELPIVKKFDIGAQPVFDIVLSGSNNMSPVDLYEIADKTLKDQFSQIAGVASVNIVGGQEREIRVELDNRIVFQNSISLTTLNQILAIQNMDLPGGQFQRRSQEYSSRVKGKFNSLEELSEIKVPTAFGNKELGKIAKISDAGKDVRVRSTYFENEVKKRDENIVVLSIIKASDGNTVELGKQIKKLLPTLREELPSGTSLDVITDKSTFISASVEDTLSNIGLGIILTAFVLIFFLHDLRSTVIAALSMPFSIISTFMLIDYSGFSLNVMTLMGLSTSVGILVANSIVVLENIFRHKEMGHNKIDSAARGTSEVVVAVIASAMTNIVVFVPIANMTSMIGQFFREFALTVTYATIFSIIVSFTLTPMLASLILPEKPAKKNKIGVWLENLFTKWEDWYRNVLAIVIKNRITSLATLGITTLIFFGSFFFASKLSFEFMPFPDEGVINVQVELPQGNNLQNTAQFLKSVEERITKYDEIKHVLTQMGKITDLEQGTNLALLKVELVPVEERAMRTDEMVTVLTKELSDVPNAMFRISAATSVGGGNQSPILFFLQGSDNAKLEEIKSDLYNKLRIIPGLTNLNTSSRSGKPEITLIPDRIKLSNTGLTVYDLAMTLRASMEGLISTKYSDDGEEYDIRITLDDNSVDSPEKIANLTIISPMGKYKIGQVAEVKFSEGYSRILHRDKSRTIQFSGDVAEGYALGDVTNEIQAEIDALDLTGSYKIKWSGSAEMMQAAVLDMGFAFILAFILTYMLLAAILESFTQPIMILSTIPLAMIGVFISLYFSGLNLSVMAMLAIVMLIGIVVNNAILILDYTNVLIKKGKDVKSALLEAAPTKLKPILMTTIAIMFGMAPMALGIGSAGKEFRQPIGVVSIGGLIVSGLLTLFVIPALYEFVHREKKVAEVKNEK